ncbi:hypothetical protein LCI18_006462 [Fusarium solani-melongenae]|uniref:Uncharacterized protein n=1 Tax=Fusarium solani subsp. cucurbitae TaxID=2747967 RepID=A0ACD3Z354_FUSSC|nr:hypothetical protein LCI18_006462 [Fusarium solani-melongenae]
MFWLGFPEQVLSFRKIRVSSATISRLRKAEAKLEKIFTPPANQLRRATAFILAFGLGLGNKFPRPLRTIEKTPAYPSYLDRCTVQHIESLSPAPLHHFPYKESQATAMSSRYVKNYLDVQYPRVERLGSYLNKLFGNNYHISLRNGKIALSTPRYLTETEKDTLRARNRHSQYERQNTAIRIHSQSNSHVDLFPSARSSRNFTSNPTNTQSHVAGACSTQTGDMDETNGKGEFEPNADLVTPDINHIPLFQPASREITLDFKQGVLKLEESDTYKEGDKRQRGFYSSRLEVGETSTVFDMRGVITWSVDHPERLRKNGVTERHLSYILPLSNQSSSSMG